MTFDFTLKAIGHPAVDEASVKLGLPLGLAPICAAIVAVCLALHLVPRTAALGAVLMTGYLGGAVLVHARLNDPLFSHTLFPIYVGAFFWAGLYLRDPRVRALFASRKEVAP
ncbi:MAG: DoxX family protein [Myxococcaceae bacterium]|nr:DoxX family protein [Myxococcaceae bacterium]